MPDNKQHQSHWGDVWVACDILTCVLFSWSLGFAVVPKYHLQILTIQQRLSILQRKASLAGVVRDALTQMALEGAIVQLVGPTDPSNNPVTTDGDGNVDDGQDSTGTFRFEGLAPGRYTLEVKHAAHVQQVIDLGRIEAGEEVSREILLVPLQAESEQVSRITGVAFKEGQLAIEDETLRDHSGITVEVVGAGVRTVTNRAGDFDVFVNAGTYTLALTAPSYARYETAPIELSRAQKRF